VSDVEPIFGRLDAAVVLAVEASNGGELSSLAQVLATFQRAFNRPVDADDLSESLGLLADARLLEYSHHEIGLAPKGRKVLRKAGAPWDARRPERLTTLLAALCDDDLAPEGTMPAPSPDDVRLALGQLRDDAGEGVQLVAGDDIAPTAHSQLLPSLGGALGGLGRFGSSTLSGGLRVTFGQLHNPGPPASGAEVEEAEETEES